MPVATDRRDGDRGSRHLDRAGTGRGAFVMTITHPMDAVSANRHDPVVRKVHLADLWTAVRQGTADFWEMPTHLVFLGLIYPIIGLVLARLVFGYDVLPLLFPLAAGFALIGPFAALGLYELSRRREASLGTSWKHAFSVFRSPSFPAITALGLLLLLIFFVWIYVANAIYVATFGYAPAASIPDFLDRIFNTPAGWTLIVVGNSVGFLFALLVLAISVVSFPLLLDRNVSPIVAILTSVRAVATNPVAMAAWGLIVAALLIVGSLPFFIGLAIVMPILGHATWHLYRKVVEP
jgi:uncharacterized membrane protein